jgi:3-oxoacyl-[acyl-carrier protein] reductase
MIDLSGKCAVITGGSRGVGRATALLMARAGATVAIGYRTRAAEAEATVAEIRALGVDALCVEGDVSDANGARDLFERAEGQLGGVDVFVGNAGVWPPEGVPLADMTEEQWRRTMAVNVDGVFFTCREASRRLRDGGSIVLVGSTAGQRGEAYHADYAASKGAMMSLVKGFCVELAARDINVNCVAPGWIDTEMAAPALGREERSRITTAIPLGRIASAEDIAGPILFLCSKMARHITGEVLNVNGGAVLAG